MPNDDLESRFTRLEQEVDRLREDVASARALTALAARDLAEFRTELQGQKIDGLEREMRAGFAMQATGMAQIITLLTRIAEPE